MIQKAFLIFLLSLLLGCNTTQPKPQSCADLATYSTNKNGTSAFMWACELGCEKYVKDHIRMVDLNHGNFYGMTPLMAAIGGGGGLVPLLVESGANINHREKLSGASALALAIDHINIQVANSVNIQVIDYLLEKGANPNIPTDNIVGHYPVHTSILYNQPKILLLLLRYHANLDVVNKKGETPLDLATRANKTEIIAIIEQQTKKSAGVE